jgi:hypothetical protein
MRKTVVVFMAAAMVVAGLVPVASARRSGSGLEAPAAATARTDALTVALQSGQLSTAQYALHRAESLFNLSEVRDEFGSVAKSDPHAATMILRDLALRLDSLEGPERARGEAILARPNQGGPNDETLEYDRPEATPIDTANFRIHYVSGGTHASTLQYATSISTIMEEVWTREVTQMGWRAPKSDAPAQPNGGNEKFDVYLGNVGADSLYGYCTTDLGQSTQEQHSYCVLDNDFSPGQFGGAVNGLNAARVTAAHEFNHAIQFSYDVTDDMWLLEATATWMEDQVYDDVPSTSINDSYQYLQASSLADPTTSADTWDFFSGFHYGQFIWMRYLSERTGSNDTIRSIFEKLAEPNFYSTKAIEAVLAAQTPSANFASSFAEFAAWNASPRTFYEEGANYENVVPPVRSKRHTLSGSTVGGGTFSSQVDHLTYRSVGFTRGPGVITGDQITLSVDLGAGDLNRAMVVLLNGSAKDIREIPMTSGVGNLTVPFGDQTEVVLVMSNGSNRMNNCDSDGWQPGENSCGGNPADENKTFKYAGVIGTTPATPGGGSTSEGPSVTNFKAAPNPFTPNGDGRKDKTKIKFNLGDAALVTLELYKGTKHLGFFFQDEDLDPMDGYFVSWNGKLGTKKASSGTYKVVLTAVGADGTTTKTTKVELIR